MKSMMHRILLKEKFDGRRGRSRSLKKGFLEQSIADVGCPAFAL